MFSRFLILGALWVIATSACPAIAAEQAGETVAVIPATAVQRSSGISPLDVKEPVFMGDLVKTSKSGQAQLQFLDNTRMIVGPGSQLTIDKFVYRGKGGAGQFSITAAKGAFRFITGVSQKQGYVIKTPTATIGVMGTRFDLTVQRNGTTNLALYDGGVLLCDRASPKRHCRAVTGHCSVMVLAPEKDFRKISDINERTAAFKRLFPYAFRQQWLLDQFRVNSGACDITYSNEPTRSQSPSSLPPPRPSEGDGGGGG
jgi:hypothetical protein